MWNSTRREFLAGSAGLLSLAAEAKLLTDPLPAFPLGRNPELVAPDTYFVLSKDPEDVCNNRWIIFEDHVLVIDATFPAGARLLIPMIRALTDKPIRFVLDTHHPDHLYGNEVFAENGAVPLRQHAGRRRIGALRDRLL